MANQLFEEQENQRHIKVKGLYNLRDLGGYPSFCGRHTIWKQIFRSDSLHNLAIEGQQQIVEMNVKTVIDLRRPQEIEQAKNVFSDSELVKYINISLIDISPFEDNNNLPNGLKEMYLKTLYERHEAIRNVFKQILTAEGAVLFHCAVGKDRTGLISGLLLDLVEVPHSIIAEDYAFSNQCLAPILPEMLSSRPVALNEEQYNRFIQCKPEYMLDVLKMLDDVYDGTAGYLRAIGLTDNDINALQKKLIS
ncbi:tyrosine-protein phosphatase [Metabacillus arenae]|uniref:Tyrosine-protein phosphatase n=1 Tax=Metabacillus arenae TaxID=2771434 RepID=A0A926NMF3_9BACI|nr:tyrosine-protein phosphatase [Metabacillus arenae]MBD1380496.1 tyrosine-protein phosphatase [Metabacillus arenae]